MLYALLKPIIQISLRAYFKRIEVIGAENLEHGATLFVCNHPSALFDPIMVASNTKRPIHFLAGAEWFGSGIQKWFFQNQFKMIPVFRPWLAEGKEKAKANNDEMFSACYTSLSKGNRIIIFPEASSVTVPWIRSIKTGAARIKLGADAASGQNIKIVPIGLNYTNSHRFQTSVIVNVGEPIDFTEIPAGDPFVFMLPPSSEAETHSTPDNANISAGGKKARRPGSQHSDGRVRELFDWYSGTQRGSSTADL